MIMDFITLEMLGTVGGAATTVTTVTQGIKMLFNRKQYKFNPKLTAFILSIMVSLIVLLTQDEITVSCAFLAFVNSFVVWLTAIGGFEVSKEIGEHFHNNEAQG